MVRVGGVMVAGVEVVVIGVNREGGQRRGEIGGGREEIGKTTNRICTGGRAFPHLWQVCSLAGAF